MGSENSAHFSDEELARIQDGDLSAARHLEACPLCGSRLRDMEAVSAAYAEYRDSVRESSMPPAPRPWARLETLVARHEAGRARSAFRWWGVPALAAAFCIIVAVALVWREAGRPSREVTELLERPAEIELPEGRLLSVRAQGRDMVRPAVLLSDSSSGSGPELAHLRMVFAAADYSWREPLSRRSFQAWRLALRTRRDSVSVIGEPAETRSYRIRTESPAGKLRSASLTLRARDLHPTQGTFEFEGEGTVELTETSAPAKQAEPPRASIAQPPAYPAPVESLAGPEDTLRVLAALDEIGADVGEPISLSDDPQHGRVIVHAGGLNRDRQREVAAALKQLPRVSLDFGTAAPDPVAPRPATAERYANSIPAPLRQVFENRLGGAVAVQEITDRVLDTSASALARTHALQILGERFPPEVEARFAAADRELLRTLRNRHVAELERLAVRIRADLKPLLASPGRANIDNGIGLAWQSGVPSLVTTAQETDSLLNRLLAGSYTQSEGESMLRGLSAQIERLEKAIRSLQGAGR